jgi:hypothetical protein
MPKIKNVNHVLLLALFSIVNAVTHAMEPSAAPDQKKSSEIADVRALLSETFAKSTSLSLTAGGRSGATLPDDAGLFSLPLLGTLESFGFRFATADGGKFKHLTQQAFFADFSLPWRWTTWKNVSVAPRLTVEGGRFESGSEHRYFASFGPSLRLTSDARRVPLFVDLGISPTVIDGSQYGQNDFGTSFNFTSHVALGLRFGRRKGQVVKLRYQHISNGSINNTNPGVNMVGIDFSFSVR